jgi:BlaI family transcriptional regulator, penicillinase repressor
LGTKRLAALFQGWIGITSWPGGLESMVAGDGLTSPCVSVIFYNVRMFNTHRSQLKPPTPLEQFIMDYVWAHPGCTAEMCREGVSVRRALKDSTIRTILRNLEEKGYVTHDVDGRTFVYRAVDTKRNVAVQAAQQLIDRFCGGSVEEFLVGLIDNQVLEPQQLQRLAEKIALRKSRKLRDETKEKKA